MKKPWKKKERSEGEENRLAILGLLFQVILIFMAVAFTLYAIASALIGSSLFVPQNAKEVLESVRTPSKYQWISESARRVVLPSGYSEEQFAIRSVALNRDKNIFLANLYGVLPDPAIYLSDRRATVRITNADTSSASDVRDGTLVTDACAAEGSPATPTEDDDEPLSTDLVALPDAEEILRSSPRLIDDKATFQGKRAWLLEFDPSARTIEQMLWRPFLREALRGDEFDAERPWIETPEEAAALQDGNYRVLWAYAWVLRDSRELAQIRVRLSVRLPEKKRIEYHLLGHLFSSDKLLEIERQSIGGEFICED